MKAKILSKFTAALAGTALCVISLFQTSCSDLWNEQHPGTYYTFTGATISDELERRSEDFSKFIEVLKRAGIWTELQTYGYHTCFAPYNEGIDSFLVERGIRMRGEPYHSVEELPKEDCDTLAWTHLVEGITCYVGEMEQGVFPKVNMNDRFLMLSFDSVMHHIEENGDTAYRLVRTVNKFSHIMEKDDSCQNGVVHTIDRCIDFTGNYVYDLIVNNPHTTLFAQALKEAGFMTVDKLGKYYDYDYKIGTVDSDSLDENSRVTLNASSRKYQLLFWDKKKTSYTIFVETDELFAQNEIHNLDELIAYAKREYDPIYPESADSTDLKSPFNSLNRFLAYHILPFVAGHDNFNTRRDMIKTFNNGLTDPEDYFTTLAPNSMMRISTEYSEEKVIGDVYINRLGREGNGSRAFKGAQIPGIKILSSDEMDRINQTPVEQIAMNGMIHYIDKILVYDQEVTDKVLNRRLRIDCGTLSPDFITSGARGAYPYEGSGKRSIGFVEPTNFHAYNNVYKIHLRPVDNDTYTYEGDAVDIEGLFDMYVKLPPIPRSGTWQLRMSFRALEQYCGIAQFYMAAVAPGADITYEDWKPLGLPLDLRVTLDDPNVGWVSDADLGSESEIAALDKSMKNRGWMKGPDSQLVCNDNHESHRQQNHMGRLTLSTEYMYANMDYYLRFKQILDKDDAQFCFDYIELVPKEVYDNEEDRH